MRILLSSSGWRAVKLKGTFSWIAQRLVCWKIAGAWITIQFQIGCEVGRNIGSDGHDTFNPDYAMCFLYEN